MEKWGTVRAGTKVREGTTCHPDSRADPAMAGASWAVDPGLRGSRSAHGGRSREWGGLATMVVVVVVVGVVVVVVGVVVVVVGVVVATTAANRKGAPRAAAPMMPGPPARLPGRSGRRTNQAVAATTSCWRARREGRCAAAARRPPRRNPCTLTTAAAARQGRESGGGTMTTAGRRQGMPVEEAVAVGIGPGGAGRYGHASGRRVDGVTVMAPAVRDRRCPGMPFFFYADARVGEACAR